MKTTLIIQIENSFTKIGNIQFTIEEPSVLPQTGEIFEADFKDFTKDKKTIKTLNNISSNDGFISHVWSKRFKKDNVTVIVHLYPSSEFERRFRNNKGEFGNDMEILIRRNTLGKWLPFEKQCKPSKFKKDFFENPFNYKNKFIIERSGYHTFPTNEKTKPLKKTFVCNVHNFKCYLLKRTPASLRFNILFFIIKSSKNIKEQISVNVSFTDKNIKEINWHIRKGMDMELAEICVNIFIKKHLSKKYSLDKNVVPNFINMIND